MNKNVCIVHFNTPALTAHLVKSINKHTPGTHIYIFDNSDKLPFVNSFVNVTVFDNTKGQIINFDQWLKKYPNKDKSGGKANKWGSAKHAYSVEKCMELIGEPFVLFDSDVLVRKDFSSLFDEIVCYKGEVIYQPNSKVKRVLPFICFINTPMCFAKNVHYFDENYMHGLHVGNTGDRYDTGAALYILTEKNKAPHREIKVADYIVHYGNGSWVDAAEKMRKPKHIPAGDWLKKYKDFWCSDDNEKIETLSFEDVFDHIYCLHYLPSEARLQKLKDELSRVGIDENAKYFSWVYDYPTSLLDIVYNDKRVNMSTPLKSSSRSYIKRVSMKHYEIIKEAYSLGYNRILILEDDVRFHKDLDYIKKMLANIPNSDIVMFDKMTCSAALEATKYKRYIKTLPSDSLYGSMNDSGVFFIFCSCYSLNRKAMKQIIDTQEQSLQPPDTPLNDKSLIGSFALINLAIQDPKLKTRESETYDKIDLNVKLYWTGENIIVKSAQQPEANNSEKKIKTSQQNNKKPNQVVFRMSTTPQDKRRIEPTPKPASQSKRPIVLDKRKRTHTRILVGKSVGYNKLYET